MRILHEYNDLHTMGRIMGIRIPCIMHTKHGCALYTTKCRVCAFFCTIKTETDTYVDIKEQCPRL